MPFATNNDLVKLYSDAMEHGVTDWTEELTLAQSDVETLIKTRWFNLEFGSGVRMRFSPSLPQFNPALLTETQWTRTTVYRALAVYILPKLSTFRPEGDSFREQLAFYQNRFEEELAMQLASGVEYDLDDDGTVTASEKFAQAQDRLYR
jgi:hypothetical protein